MTGVWRLPIAVGWLPDADPVLVFSKDFECWLIVSLQITKKYTFPVIERGFITDLVLINGSIYSDDDERVIGDDKKIFDRK